MKLKCEICGREFEGEGFSALPYFTGTCCSVCHSLVLDEELRTEKTIDYSRNGKCSRCGMCCTDFLPMSREEISTIRAYVETHSVQRTFSTSAFGEAYLLCPFLSSNGCQVYPVRPSVCRGFNCFKRQAQQKRNKILAESKAVVNTERSGFESLHSIFFNDKPYSDFLLKQLKEGNVCARDEVRSNNKHH